MKDKGRDTDSRPYRASDVDLMLWQFGQGLLTAANSGSFEGDCESLNKMAMQRSKELLETFGNRSSNGRTIIDPAPSFHLNFDYESNGDKGKRFVVKKVVK